MTASRSSPVAMSTTCGSGASEASAREAKSRPRTTTSSAPPVMIAETAIVRSNVVLPAPPEPNTSHPARFEVDDRRVLVLLLRRVDHPDGDHLARLVAGGLGAWIDEHVGERDQFGEHVAPRLIGAAASPRRRLASPMAARTASRWVAAAPVAGPAARLRRVVGAHERCHEHRRLHVVADAAARRSTRPGRRRGRGARGGPSRGPSAARGSRRPRGCRSRPSTRSGRACAARCAGWCWRGCCR